jgi:hypothetical protein
MSSPIATRASCADRKWRAVWGERAALCKQAHASCVIASPGIRTRGTPFERQLFVAAGIA